MIKTDGSSTTTNAQRAASAKYMYGTISRGQTASLIAKKLGLHGRSTQVGGEQADTDALPNLRWRTGRHPGA